MGVSEPVVFHPGVLTASEGARYLVGVFCPIVCVALGTLRSKPRFTPEGSTTLHVACGPDVRRPGSNPQADFNGPVPQSPHLQMETMVGWASEDMGGK